MYQPKVRDDLIPRLYRLGKTLDVPMTRLATVLMDYGITMLEQSLKRMGSTPPDDNLPKQPVQTAVPPTTASHAVHHTRRMG